jgi:hypothetical protein
MQQLFFQLLALCFITQAAYRYAGQMGSRLDQLDFLLVGAADLPIIYGKRPQKPSIRCQYRLGPTGVKSGNKGTAEILPKRVPVNLRNHDTLFREGRRSARADPLANYQVANGLVVIGR